MRLLREPLLHFLLGGAALFLLYGEAAGRDDAPDQIVIDERRVANLASTFQRTWMRPPTRSELDGLVAEYVKEEVLYREALALGLDDDDLIIRRRLRQKMEFLSSDLADAAEPSEAELEGYLEENQAAFRLPATTTFVQVYLDAERADAAERAGALLERLAASPVADRPAGDATLLPEGLQRASDRDVANQFGTEFAQALGAAPVGVWSGPIRSSYGLHLVRVGERVAGRLPPLAEIRDRVDLEWSVAQRQEANDAFYRALRERYRVEVRMPADDLAVRE